ncbi:unnamed protein product, partial [Durusdinium trenchii]
GLHVKLEEELSTALAEERKTRGKAISDVCQYIEHVVALQESDAKTEKRRTDSVVAGLEDRVQVLEDCFFRQPESADAVGNIGQMPVELPARGMVPGADIDFPSAHSQPGMAASPALPARTDAHSEGQAESDSGGAFTLFSEEMRESLKHIVRKVGDTMSKDSDNRAGQGSPPNMRVVGICAQPRSGAARSVCPKGHSHGHILRVMCPYVLWKSLMPRIQTGCSQGDSSASTGAKPRPRIWRPWRSAVAALVQSRCRPMNAALK